MPIHVSNGLSYLTFDLFDQHHIRHGIFMRHGGVSPHPWKSLNMATSVGDSRENVIENRTRIAGALRIGENSFFDVWQVHSSDVIIASEPRPQGVLHQKGDAIMTNQPNVSLLMLFADCVPVFLFDVHKRIAVLIHAGWQGTARMVVSAAINKMRSQFGCQPDDMIAGIGPAISAERYEVRPELFVHFDQKFFNMNDIKVQKGSSHFLDLKKANGQLLQREGITQIENLDVCTAGNTSDWYSHRGENGKTGRFAAVLSVN
jgi:hypothetical protein